MTEHHAYGTLAYDVAHMLGAGVLVLSFVLLYQRRLSAVINGYALQALVLAAAAAWQAWAQDAPHLYLTAAITLGAKAVAIPLGLRMIVRRLNVNRSLESALGIFPSMALGVLLVALSILVVLPVTLNAQVITREQLALALSVVLIGMLMMITRRTALTQVIGFMSLENGIILAAISVSGMPLVVELSVSVLVLLAFGVFGIFFFRIRDRFDSLNLEPLDRMEQRPR